MRITQLTVTYRETRTFGDHNNTSPQISISADVDNDAGTVAQLLTEKAIRQVRAIIDDTLEANGEAAYYSTDPRFQVLVSHKRQCVIVVPNDNFTPPEDFTHVYFIPRGMRQDAADNAAQHYAFFEHKPEYTAYSSYDGDLSHIPPLPNQFIHPHHPTTPTQDPAQPAGDEDTFDQDDQPFYDHGDDEPDNTIITIPA